MTFLPGVQRAHDLLLFRLPAKEKGVLQLICDVHPINRPDELYFAPFQARLAAAKLDEMAEGIKDLSSPSSLVPRERAAAVRVFSSLHPDLVPVVDGRRAREGEQKRRGQDQSAAISTAKGEEARLIVAPKEGIRVVVHPLGVAFPNAINVSDKALSVPFSLSGCSTLTKWESRF